MKATIKSISKKTVKTEKTSFDKIVIECDVIINDKNEVKTYKSEMSTDYAKKYFNFCHVSSREAIGMECEVTLRTRAYHPKGNPEETRYVKEVKYLNLLDEAGKPIIMSEKSADLAEDVGF